MKVAVVGAGRVGCAIGRTLQQRGVEVVFVARHEPKVDCAPWVTPDTMDAQWDMVLFAVPDAQIRQVAREVARQIDPGAVLGHFSGALDSACLGTGFAGRFSAHPAYAFPLPGRNLPMPEGLIFTVEGDQAGVARAGRLMDVLRARHVTIAPGDKPLYHAACVIAANLTSLNALIATRMLRSIGHPWSQDVVRVLLSSVLGLQPFDETTVTGPAARGDIDVLSRHIRAINARFPEFSEYYKTATGTLSSLLVQAGVIGTQQWKRIKAIVRADKTSDSSRN